MKFSEIKKDEWHALIPYVDTCLLPVSGLNGTETPVEAADKLEKLRDLLDLIERPYRGRTVTYPAWHYVVEPDQTVILLQRTVQKLKEQGFRHVIIVSVDGLPEQESIGADLVVTPELEQKIGELVPSLWMT